MRKAMMFLLAALLALTVCGCSSAGNRNTYTAGQYTVDMENGTITDGTNTYRFTFSGYSSGYDVEITYPDGSTYWWRKQSGSGGVGFGGGGWSDDYDPDRYVSGDELCRVLEAGAPSPQRERSPGQVLVGVVLVGFGLFNALSPQTAWHLSEGWKFRDAEPSEMALGLARAGGVLAIIIGVIAILAS